MLWWLLLSGGYELNPDAVEVKLLKERNLA